MSYCDGQHFTKRMPRLSSKEEWTIVIQNEHMHTNLENEERRRSALLEKFHKLRHSHFHTKNESIEALSLNDKFEFQKLDS